MFERDWHVFGQDFLQTLEPRAYYLKIPAEKIEVIHNALDERLAAAGRNEVPGLLAGWLDALVSAAVERFDEAPVHVFTRASIGAAGTTLVLATHHIEQGLQLCTDRLHLEQGRPIAA